MEGCIRWVNHDSGIPDEGLLIKLLVLVYQVEDVRLVSRAWTLPDVQFFA